MGGNVSQIGNIFPDVAIKAACRAGTTANITLSGLQTVDGVALAAGDRVLVMNQTDQTQNGIWQAATSPWIRTVDASKNTDFIFGSLVLVALGAQNAGLVFEQTCQDSPIIIGTSHVSFNFLIRTGPGIQAAADFDTVALAIATPISALQIAIRTRGFTTAGDGGGAVYFMLSGAPSPVTPAQFQNTTGSWWQLAPQVAYTPEMFGAIGNGASVSAHDDAPAINAMFEYVPAGATCQLLQKYYRVKKQSGQNYGIRLRKSIRLLGALGGGASGNAAIVYDNSYLPTDNVFLIQPPGSDAGSLFTIFGLELGGLYFVPFAASLGFVLTQFSWDPTKEYCLYARDIVHFDVRGASSGAGTCALNRVWMHDCYIFSSGGPGGGQGTGVSLNVDCALDSAGAFTCVFERLFFSGGSRFTNMGDSNTLRDIRMDGKAPGIEWTSIPGAVEQLIDQVASATNGAAILWHWGKARFTGLNLEAHGLQVSSPDVALIDIRNDVPGVAGQVENGLIFDGITVGDQTAPTGGASTPLTSLIYINNSINAIFRRVCLYSSAVTANGIFIDTNCTDTRIDGPFTRQALAAIPTMVADHGVGTYGVDLTPAQNTNAFVTFSGSWANSTMKMRKNPDGTVSLSGAVTGTFAAGAVLTLPLGFRPDATRVFVVGTDGSGTAGSCTVQVSAAGLLSITAFNGTPGTLFLSGIRFKEATHDAIVSET